MSQRVKNGRFRMFQSIFTIFVANETGAKKTQNERKFAQKRAKERKMKKMLFSVGTCSE